MKRLISIVVSIATIVIIPYVVGLLNSATEFFLTKHSISYNRLFGGILIFCLVILVVISVVLLFFFMLSHKINITHFSEVISRVVYNGSPLFELTTEESVQFGMLLRKKSRRILFAIMQWLGFCPVVYYNVTAKRFLNWIDYLYLHLLNELSRECGARIIISLHVDEVLLKDGLYDERVKDNYLLLKETAANIIRKVVPNAQITDEFEYYLKAKNSMDDYPEYFISTIISNINHYVRELEQGRINYDGFIRKESNILSVMPISVLSRKFRHLFVLDYIGSFEVWKLQPYNQLKQQNNILFIACNTIKDKNGNRLPSWKDSDGVNLTDTEEQITEKIHRNDRVVNEALLELLSGKAAGNMSDVVLHEKCIAILSMIKGELKL